MTRKLLALLALLGSSTAWACELEVTGFARETIPGQSMSAAYLHLRNDCEAARTLVAVTAQGMDVSIHETREVDGRVQMRALEQLVVPASGIVRMAPGGLHLMLEGAALKAGQALDVVLKFADGESQTVALAVEKIGAGKHHHHH